MRYKFNFVHVDVSQALKLYSQEHFDRLSRFLLKDGSWQIMFKKTKHECVVQVDVNSAWGHFKATAKDLSFYSAVDAVAEKLGKQFKKKKDKHQAHSKPQHSKQAKLKRVNPLLEYDHSPYFDKKSA